MATIHVIYDGKTEDLASDEVGVPANANGEQIKTALAQHYDVATTEFRDHFVEINPNGNVTVRPNTPFGGSK